MALVSLARACGEAVVCAVCESSRGLLAKSAASALPVHHFAGDLVRGDGDIVRRHLCLPNHWPLVAALDGEDRLGRVGRAGGRRRPVEGDEFVPREMSTALCDWPSNGQAASGSVAWAVVMLVGQAEAAQPVPP